MSSSLEEKITCTALRLVDSLSPLVLGERRARDPHSLLFWRERILLWLMVGGGILGGLGLLLGVGRALQAGPWVNALVYSAVYACGLVITFLKNLPYRVRAWIWLMGFFTLGTVSLWASGFLGPGRIWLFFFALGAALLLGLRGGIAALALNAGALAWILWWAGPQAPWWQAGNPQFSLLLISSCTGSMTAYAVCAVGIATLANSIGRVLEEERILSAGLAEANRRLQAEVAVRLEAERAARVGEKNLREILEGSAIATFVIDREHRITHWNRACEVLTGVPASSMVGTRKAGEVFYGRPRPVMGNLVLDGAPESRIAEHYDGAYRRSALLPGAFEGEGFFPHFGEKGKWVFFTAAPIKNAQGETVGAVETLQDITARKEAETALEKSEAFHRGLMETLEDMVFRIDLNGRFSYLNPAFERLTGHRARDWVGRPFLELVAPESAALVREQFRRGITGESLATEEVCLLDHRGEKIPVEINVVNLKDEQGRTAGRLGVARDLRDRIRAREERARLERRLRQSEKMEAIGTLAGGIAHDFNNILYAVIGYTELSMDEVGEGHPAWCFLEEVLRAAQRAKDLVGQILTFSRQGPDERRPVRVDTVVREAMGLLRASIPSTIEIRQEIETEALVTADPVRLHQVVVNLCTNAAQAMEEKGGTLTVRLEEKPEVPSRLGPAPGPYLLLTVEDTGPGMPEKVLDRVFEPFFTTKDRGKGTGMGLSVVHGIVEGYGGTVTAQSEPGKGAVFRVYLPATGSGAETGDSDDVKCPVPMGRGERILFVDDEEALVALGQRMIESLGYRVTTRVSSLEALELFRASPSRFDAVVTDLTMPHMKGDELAREITRIRRDIPVILCTGFGAEAAGPSKGIRAVVNKPILRKDLAQTLAEILREAP
ncbi:MAG: PAS domain S-box protein [Deltaproteobacteria bacterium]|nr:PAS domain S-box protein [Deltaproteobacteria bacterium]